MGKKIFLQTLQIVKSRSRKELHFFGPLEPEPLEEKMRSRSRKKISRLPRPEPAISDILNPICYKSLNTFLCKIMCLHIFTLDTFLILVERVNLKSRPLPKEHRAPLPTENIYIQYKTRDEKNREKLSFTYYIFILTTPMNFVIFM